MWRLHGGGWRVRYEPAALVRHDHRVTVSQWARRKFDYGTSAAPLALRHPGSVPPAVTSAVALAPLVFLRARRPWAAGAAGLLAALGLAHRLPAFPGRAQEAARLVVGGSATTAQGLAKAATRAWLPATLVVVAACPRPAPHRPRRCLRGAAAGVDHPPAGAGPAAVDGGAPAR